MTVVHTPTSQVPSRAGRPTTLSGRSIFSATPRPSAARGGRNSPPIGGSYRMRHPWPGGTSDARHLADLNTIFRLGGVTGDSAVEKPRERVLLQPPEGSCDAWSRWGGDARPRRIARRQPRRGHRIRRFDPREFGTGWRTAREGTGLPGHAGGRAHPPGPGPYGAGPARRGGGPW